ncbi:MAG: TetR/AcrR family transcriptional regulator [Acidimicrobiia bacterium]|nr:TetR/AcrR family transcriptional regulator [Acidimicrobiia bacterium]
MSDHSRAQVARGVSPDRRRRILDAALDCFREQGIAATTIDDIRRRSGASVGSIYHHFGGRDGVVAAACAEPLETYVAGFLDALGTEEGPEAGIVTVVRFHLKRVRATPLLSEIILAASLAGRGDSAEKSGEMSALLRPHFTELGVGVRRWLGRQVEAGTLRPLPRDLQGALLMGPLFELTRLQLSGRVRASDSAIASQIGTAIWRALANRSDALGRAGRI